MSSGSVAAGEAVDRPRGGGRFTAPRDRETVVSRQREAFGGFSWGSAFFGWLVAIGLAALLIALIGALGAAIGFSQLSAKDARSSADTIGIVGGVLMLIVLAIAYHAGGYVAGRFARFDGARVVLFTLPAAISGGKAGERVHRKVDRVGL